MWEDSRRQITKAGLVPLIGGASQPHCQASLPMGPPCLSLLATSVLHRPRVGIYAVLLSRFDPRVQDA